jgi:transcriptional regulator with XRE-family HTH domain
MGTRSRPKPKNLARKLKQIRLSLGLSQNEIIEKLGVEETIVRSTISAFERGVREPSYPMLFEICAARRGKHRRFDRRFPRTSGRPISEGMQKGLHQKKSSALERRDKRTFNRELLKPRQRKKRDKRE